MPPRSRTRAGTAGKQPARNRDAGAPASALCERLFRSLYLIRRVEEEIVRVYPSDAIKSPVHLSIGQEAVAVAVCETLRREDVVFGSYRGHAMYLAKGGDPGRMIAELYGRVAGCAKGKGGSMHLVDVANGVMGTSAVVGSTISNAVGYAYANRYLRRSAVVVSFFGDGATEEGAFYESLNFAALKRLPIVFVCENNGYAIHARQSMRQPLANICERAAVFGIPAERIEHNDVLRMHERVGRAVNALRAGKSGSIFFRMPHLPLEGARRAGRGFRAGIPAARGTRAMGRERPARPARRADHSRRPLGHPGRSRREHPGSVRFCRAQPVSGRIGTAQ
jgi:TPP-dependent pyruvate/acetoin dehydrogenase alpha subunit